MMSSTGKQNTGKDFNYYEEVTVAGVTDFTEDCQAFSKFRGARRMIFVCTAGSVEFSFNGNTIHGSMDSALPQAAQLNFGPRQEDKVWVRGTGTVQIHMWSI